MREAEIWQDGAHHGGIPWNPTGKSQDLMILLQSQNEDGEGDFNWDSNFDSVCELKKETHLNLGWLLAIRP